MHSPTRYLLAALAAASLASATTPSETTERSEAAPSGDGAVTVAIQAGTVHTVSGTVLSGGATVLVRQGRIVAVGAELEIPSDAAVFDYGPDAVLIPGLVAPLSGYASGTGSLRTADPDLRAVDGFDFFSANASALSGGVTSLYITPARNRLIAGLAAMVKTTGADRERRILSSAAAVHGTITSAARNLAGYWVPPVPPTVDVGMGGAIPQLPRSLMGARVALRELVGGEPAGGTVALYGGASARLAELLGRGVPLNIEAESGAEIRSLLGFVAETGVACVLHGASEAGDLAEEIAAAGLPVVYELPFTPSLGGVDRGEGPDAFWPTFDVPARLAAAGVSVSIASGSMRDLRFAAALASQGGLDEAEALRAITLTPARTFGVADRVGSLAPGRDADLVVLNGPPLETTSTVIATWSDGELAWKAHETTATVIEVAELHVGDGEVLRPGQVLLLDGVIADVGRRVSHPRGATVVRGWAAMPGIVDALGHLGLEGSSRAPKTDFELSTLIAPGDDLDRRVASRGITTVAMSPRGARSTTKP